MKDANTETHFLLPLRTARACAGTPAPVWVLARDSVRATSISLHPTKGTARAGRRSAASRATRTTETVRRWASAAFSPGGVKCVDVDTPDHKTASAERFLGKRRRNMVKRGRHYQCPHFWFKEIDFDISKAVDRSCVRRDCTQISTHFRKSPSKGFAAWLQCLALSLPDYK